MTLPTMLVRRALVPAAVVGALALAACGTSDPLAEDGESPSPEAETGAGGGTETGTGAVDGTITVGGANFTEMLVMQEMYAALLRDAGYEVEIVSSDAREIYAQALVDGQIDAVPEYAATMAEYLNRQANGPDAEPVASNDAAETVEAMQALAEAEGLAVLDPAEAASQNGFAILEAVATEQDVSTLSEFAAAQPSIVLSATEECPDRLFCQVGLEETYGFEVTEVLPLGFGSPQAKEAVVAGQADMALVGTTDATLADDGLVLLEDDQDLQLADNLVPVVTAEAAADAELVETLNSLATVLTTDDLATLNAQVDVERRLPAEVAEDYLAEQGLVTG